MIAAGGGGGLGPAVARVRAALSPGVVERLAPPALRARLAGSRVAWAPAPDGADGGAALRQGPGGTAVLDGVFPCVPGAAAAEWLLLGVRAAGGDGPAAAWVPRRAPGLAVTPREALGLRGAAMAEVRLEGCAVPPDRLARGGSALRDALAEERHALASAVLDAAEAVFDDTLGWLAVRPFGAGRVLGEQQAVRHRLADLAGELEVARAFAREPWPGDGGGDGEPAACRAAMRALVCAGAARAVVEGCQQLRGARGYGEGDPASVAYRDLLALGLLPAFHPEGLERAAADDLFVAAAPAAGEAP